MLNIVKRHFRENNRKLFICLVTSWKAQYAYYQWQIMEMQASSFATSDNDSFPSAFVEYSTDIAVLIAAVLIAPFLIRMSVQAGQKAPVSFNTRFSVKGGLNSE